MKRILALAVVAAALVVAAVPALAATKTIKLVDNKYSPASASVARGTTVVFKWAGKNPHNIVVVKGPVKFQTGVKTKGTYKRKFTRKGSYSIVCTIHSGMTLTLKVR
jgi:plastocyanin